MNLSDALRLDADHRSESVFYLRTDRSERHNVRISKLMCFISHRVSGCSFVVHKTNLKVKLMPSI